MRSVNFNEKSLKQCVVMMALTSQSTLAPFANDAECKLRMANVGSSRCISLVSNWSWLFLVVAIIYQCIFFASLPNFIALGCILLTWALFTNIFLQPTILHSYPLSIFILLGFITTQLYFPLLFTSLEGKPVIFNLELPYQVFLHSTAAFVVLVLAHAVYRSLVSKTARETSSTLVKLGFFNPPSGLQLWMMGAIGLGATFYVFLYSPSIGREATGAALDKAIMALIPFSYAPFFIPFSRLYGSSKLPTGKLIPLLLIYTLLLFLISIGRNSRGGFMIGFSSVGFSYVLGLLLGVYKAQFFTMRNAFIAIGALWLFTGPIADIGTAMVIVRQQKREISYSDLIINTLNVFNDKEATRLRRLSDADESGNTGWDENYLKNIFLARFCNIKFNDLSLVRASKLPDHDPRMLQYSINYVYAELPQPILDLFGLTSVDKVALRGASVGDYIYFFADGPPEVLGYYITGHFAGTGMAAFGWWYLLLLGIGMVPVFLLFDKFFMINLFQHASKIGNPSFCLSLCGMLSLDSIFRFLNPFESVTTIALFLLRGWVQMALIYFVIYHITRLLSGFVLQRRVLSSSGVRLHSMNPART